MSEKITRYLMRAPASPFENPSHMEAMKKDLINTNSGNLMFPHSISRTLMTANVEIDYSPMKKAMTLEEIEYANEHYDAVIIPLANAFRYDFENSLRNMTAAINQLSIPCIVVGVGYQGSLRDIGEKRHPWDDAVIDFCKAVLNKSECIGVRGKITGNYLKSLGFRENIDYRVIGCPSMFLYGADLPKPKPLNLSEDIRIHVNMKAALPVKMHHYLEAVCRAIPDHYYIAQNHYEYQLLYAGRSLLSARRDFKRYSDNYPIYSSHPLYRENRVRGFVSAEAWLAFLRDGDLNFGTRIHGNIAGILAGLPVFIAAPDSRVLELVEYHNIPHTTIPDLDESKDIFHLLDGVDFDTVLNGHKERFDYYLAFLNDNGLDTIHNHEMTVVPFDEKIKEIEFNGPLIPFFHVSEEEQMERLTYWDYMIDQKEDELEKAKRTLENERRRLKEKNQKLKDKNQKLKDKNQKVKDELAKVRSSRSFKIGKAITSPARIIRGE